MRLVSSKSGHRPLPLSLSLGEGESGELLSVVAPCPPSPSSLLLLSRRKVLLRS